MVEALRALHARPAESELAADPGKATTGLVFPASSGGAWRPSNFDSIWWRFKKKQGLNIRFHDLRHTHATQLLAAGSTSRSSPSDSAAQASRILWALTHVMPGIQEEVAARINEGLGEALAG